MARNFSFAVILIALFESLSGAVSPSEPVSPSVRAVESQTVNVGSRKQLFIDDYVIESLDGATKKLNQPTKHPGNPLIPWLPEDHPFWDADLQIYFPNVLYDDQARIFKLWYGLWERDKEDSASALAYATSEDGVQWNRPHLGLVEYRGTKNNNVLMPRNGLCCGVFKDHHEKNPAKRYKMLHMCSGAYKVCAAYSADGLRWNRYNNGYPVIDDFPDGHFADSQMVCYRDEQLGKYVAIIRQRFDSDGGGRHKCPAMAESDDFLNWTSPRPLLCAEQADGKLRQFYCMEVMQYEGLRLGFVTVYQHGHKPNPPYDRGQVQLAYSRDGRNWSRWGQDVFLPLSNRPGDFDWGYIYTAHAPVVVGDEIYVYYGGHGHDHRHDLPVGVTKRTGGLGLGKLRLDGFVCVEAGGEEGRLTTKPLMFVETQLVINADATSGNVIVEILDDEGEPIRGFTKLDCIPFRDNEIRHKVRWQGRSDLRKLERKTVRLRFYLKTAKLFSFQFTPT